MTARPSADPLLTVEHVTKRFGGVTALNDVAFELRRGEIHALLGENGAGKSTLIKILGGIHAPDSGLVRLDGQSIAPRGPADAQRLGIRIIHQELSLAPNLSVAENIYLGREPTRGGLLDRRRMRAQARELITVLGLHEIRDVESEVGTLSVAHQQLVEIARALSCQARVLVLDEPTSSLSEAETEALFHTLIRLRAQGVGIIYISHRLEEILRLADRITVLRDGRSIGTQATSSVDARQLVHWMVGREIRDHFPRPPHNPGPIALEVLQLCGPRIHQVSFSVRAGEVVGIAGLVGAGRSELLRAIFGIDRLWRGEIRVAGRRVTIRRPLDALRAGIVLVPEDRKQEGLIMSQSVSFNVALPWVRHWIPRLVPRYRVRDQIVRRAVDAFRIRVADLDQPIDSLSGGNQQKALVGRWMERPPKILLLDEPTRGVDVGAREELFHILASLVTAGIAVVIVSSDLDELAGVAHRVIVYRDGRILASATAGELSREQMMAQLTGAET